MKGQIQTLESVIAVATIAIVFLSLYPAQQIPNLQSVNRKLLGFNALQAIDGSNQFRQYVVANNSQAIVNMLSPLLKGVNYNVSICGSSCGSPNIAANDTVSVSYLVAGNASTYFPTQVVLYIWTQ